MKRWKVWLTYYFGEKDLCSKELYSSKCRDVALEMYNTIEDLLDDMVFTGTLKGYNLSIKTDVRKDE